MYQRQRNVPVTLPRGIRKPSHAREVTSENSRDGLKPRSSLPVGAAKRETGMEPPRKGGRSDGDFGKQTETWPTNITKRETGTESDVQQPKALSRVGTGLLAEPLGRSDSEVGKQANILNKTALSSNRKKIAKILGAVDQKEGDYDFSIKSNVEKFKSSHLQDISEEDPETQDLTLLHKAIFQVPEGTSDSEVFTKRRELLGCLLDIGKYRELFSKEKYLITAIKTGRKDFMNFVLENFWDLASITLEDGKNNTCMHAEFDQLVDCVDLLVRKSKLKNDIVKAQDEKGNTLLHIAVRFRNNWMAAISQKDLVEHFLEACPQALRILNKAGQSPYQHYVASLPQDYNLTLDGNQESKTIGFLLKNHYMRFEQRNDTIKFLYGDNQGESTLKINESYFSSNYQFRTRD